jgi:hypothetical protein
MMAPYRPMMFAALLAAALVAAPSCVRAQVSTPMVQSQPGQRQAAPGQAVPGQAAPGQTAPGRAPKPGTPVPAAPADGPIIAVFQGLDKTTARVTKFEAPVGTVMHFGTLSVKARTCNKHPPEEPPESAAFVEIQEVRPDEQTPSRLFEAWMFASSPALSALEHPVYDVWLLDCRMSSTSPSSSRPK